MSEPSSPEDAAEALVTALESEDERSWLEIIAQAFRERDRTVRAKALEEAAQFLERNGGERLAPIVRLLKNKQ